jgi:rubredoxin
MDKELIANLVKRIKELEAAVIDLKIENTYGGKFSKYDSNLCPHCGDEKNWKQKENSECEEYFECMGCGHTYDEEGNFVDVKEDEYLSKEDIADIRADMKYHEKMDGEV